MDFGSGQSVDIVTDKCLAPLDGLGKAYLKLSAPLAIGLAFVIVFILAHFWHKALHNKNQVVCKIHDKFPKRIKNRTMNNFKTAAMQVALFIYLPLINASLSTFACEKVFDQADTSLYTWRMKQYSDVVCWVRIG